jgi:PAS domain S-box-containing protein
LLEALRRSEQNFRTIIERSPLAMSISSHDKLLYVNPAMFEYLGFTGDAALMGPTLAQLSDEIIHPDDRARTRDAFRTLFASLDASAEPAATVRTNDVRLRRRDGAIRVCDMHGVVVRRDGVLALVTYLHDQTERALAERRTRLEDRMAALGTLAAGVAHEINNPLTYVLTNVELVAHRLGAAAPELADVRTGLERIRQIVRSLRTFSRSDEETIGPVAIADVVDGAAAMAESHLRHRGRLLRDYTPALPVRGNAARLGQAFLNLLVNAAQSLDESRRAQNEVRLVLRSDERAVTLEVRDNGAGMAPEEVARAFDPFFTTKPVGVGTGLGLYVCHGIIVAHGGEVHIESELGEGTCVRVRLPVWLEEPAPARAAGAPAPPKTSARVLVIDDEPLLLDAVRRLLEAEFEVTAAAGGREAIARLSAGERFDLVLCDLMMPDVSGMDLLARVRASFPEVATRLVFMSGGAVTDGARAVLEDPAVTHIQKPFEAVELLGLVRARVAATPA